MQVVDGVVINWETDSLHGEFTTAQLTIRSRSMFVGMSRRWYISLHKPVEEENEKHPSGVRQVTMKVDGVVYVKAGPPRIFHRPPSRRFFGSGGA